MTGIKKLLLDQRIMVFLFCLAVLVGPAISTLLNFELHERCTDCYAYKGVASFNFHQNPVRRYRVIIPFIASAVNSIINKSVDKTAPDYFYGDFSLPVSFFLVNTFIICLFGVVIYRYCRAYGISVISSLIGLLVLLSCRWTAFLAAMPMVDSLYCLVIALCLLGIKTKNNTLIVLSIFLGPFAKESFVFFLPLIFFFSHISGPRLLLYFLLSGLLVLGFRYLYERAAGLPLNSGLSADFDQVNYFRTYWAGLFSLKGIYKIFTNVGLWIFIPALAAVIEKKYFRMMKEKLDKYIIVFMLVVLVHMLFGQYERHFYLAMPVICLLVAASADILLQRFNLFDKITAGKVFS